MACSELEDLNIAALLVEIYSYTSLIVGTHVANLRKHMKREEAVAIYKEIIKLADCMGSNAFNLKLSKKDDPHSEGYQIRITMESDAEIMEQIKAIAKKNDLAVREEKGEVIVYKPKKNRINLFCYSESSSTSITSVSFNCEKGIL